jgi:hypothetical protein
MMSEHLLQRLDDPPIRTTVEARKRQQPVREIRSGMAIGRFGSDPLPLRYRKLCSGGQNRCDLVTNGRKVPRRQ